MENPLVAKKKSLGKLVGDEKKMLNSCWYQKPYPQKEIMEKRTSFPNLKPYKFHRDKHFTSATRTLHF